MICQRQVGFSFLGSPICLWHIEVFSVCKNRDSDIKPQQKSCVRRVAGVVYLLIPTSNHNLVDRGALVKSVVYLLIPTSNHNRNRQIHHVIISCISFDSYIKPQRFRFLSSSFIRCISFDSYIKPQPCAIASTANISCISFDSYIKPQRSTTSMLLTVVVYLLIPTSNHNCCEQALYHKSVVYLLIPTSNHN